MTLMNLKVKETEKAFQEGSMRKLFTQEDTMVDKMKQMNRD